MTKKPDCIPINEWTELPKDFGSIIRALRLATPNNEKNQRAISQATLYDTVGLTPPYLQLENVSQQMPSKNKSVAISGLENNRPNRPSLSSEDIFRFAHFFEKEKELFSQCALKSEDGLSLAGQFFKTAIDYMQTRGKPKMLPEDYGYRNAIITRAFTEGYIDASERQTLEELLVIPHAEKHHAEVAAQKGVEPLNMVATNDHEHVASLGSEVQKTDTPTRM